ncbi:MAG: PEP-CTERM sorting domain-containing protein [Planctomycetes bacterium]|nr:PEP-CTERM sorting domain-containing protein [Planctomycetota bacterium]
MPTASAAGGGSGGSAFSLAAGVGVSGAFSMGGAGGGGGKGGVVTLTSDSQVTTQGRQAHALIAQSIGGGGGSGGNAISLGVTVPPGAPAIGIGYTVSVGGDGGDGGNGGKVNLSSTGDVATSAFRSYGILAQSIGGGGGDGGYSVSGSVAITSIVTTLAIGGFGGGGGSGDAVAVGSTGDILTQGNLANGILAQSVGGGGGAGGNSLGIQIVLKAPKPVPGIPVSTTYTLGGCGGDGGAGGVVQVVNQGQIETQGIHAHGILAQSVGGGGGAGGDQSAFDLSLGWLIRVESALSLGGGGSGPPGNGAAVTVDNSNSLTTHGDFAQGILAQSIGGGGGAGGLCFQHGLVDLIDGVPSVKLRVWGNGGSGGAVTLSNSGAIATYGGFAHGILAQSIGGGGGFAAISEDFAISTLQKGVRAIGIPLPDTPGLGIAFAGSGGASGSASDVSVTHTGSITTFGHTSHGILAQSDAGSGRAGTVTVTLGSEILAQGANSHGILAQSVGSSGLGGNIGITIGSGTVQGGSGLGAGVYLDGGANNTLTNAGHISALSGMAVRATVGNDTIVNNGIIAGNVSLGTGVNAIMNCLGAILNSGPDVNLGAGNILTNAGVISPGGLGAICQTTIVGDLALEPTSLLEIEIGGIGEDELDRIILSGALGSASGGPAPLAESGSVVFSLLPGLDLASLIGPGGSVELLFLVPRDLAGGALTMYCDFPDCPQGFSYSVFHDESGAAWLRVAASEIPEPATLTLLALGGLALLRRRRKS